MDCSFFALSCVLLRFFYCPHFAPCTTAFVPQQSLAALCMPCVLLVRHGCSSHGHGGANALAVLDSRIVVGLSLQPPATLLVAILSLRIAALGGFRMIA